MRKYLAYYETEWPANIAELTAVENKPFVGYLKGEGVLFTVIPKPVTGPADNEIWYMTVNGTMLEEMSAKKFGANSIVSHTYENGRGVIKLDVFATEISNAAFIQCFELTSITIPNSVTSIGNYVFHGCTSLNTVNFEGTVEEWNNVEKGTSWYGAYDEEEGDCRIPATVVHCIDGDVEI